jgi:hypothetical protein
MNDQPFDEQPKNNRNMMIIGVVAVVLLCCCCAIAAGVYLWNNGDALLEQFGSLPQVLSTLV